VGLKPDLLLCVADACRHENGDIPMLFVQVGDPIDHRLVRSIARPGGNITGIANLRGDLTAKRLELFKEIVPGGGFVGWTDFFIGLLLAVLH
jgi:putative tryptophan/tyrosine transport system substrate-binding protein